MKITRAFLVFSFLLLFTPLINAAAQEVLPSDDEVNTIAHKLYCPVCENTPLDVCPTTACHQWRELIRTMLAEGKTEEEINQFFVENYGARVLAEPPRSGLNWIIYLVPPVAFLAGAYLLFRGFSLWKRTVIEKPGTESPSTMQDNENDKDTSSPEAEYLQRLEREVKDRL
jgi:cytochrome c-type biogenesis protein CcmH